MNRNRQKANSKSHTRKKELGRNNLAAGKGLYDEDVNTSKVKSEPEDLSNLFSEIEYGVNIKDSVIYLHGDIVMGMLFEVIAKTRLILDNRPEENSSDPVTLLINSDGGDVHEALGIIDYFNSLEVLVNVVARGRAMSAGCLILTCATGSRAASKSCTLMLHELSSEIGGKMSDIKNSADHIQHLENEIFQLISSKSKETEEYWRKVCGKDFYMTAEKALSLGLIDSII
jgi:ATP-dependent Clp protease protease subunit